MAESLGRSLIVKTDQALGGQEIRGKWFICDDKIVRISFDLIPEEALKFLREKSLTISGVEYKQVLFDVRSLIVQAIRDKITFDELKANVNQLFDYYGITKLDNRHLDTIFRTNLFTSYAVGQYEQANSMADSFPLWRYSAIHDSRSRHLSLEGIYRMGKGPLPPVDYNCRCTAIYLHISQITGQEIIRETWNTDLVRFTAQEAFTNWKETKVEFLTKDVGEWIQENI